MSDRREIVHDSLRAFLVVSTTAGLFANIAALIFITVPASNRDVLLVLVGALATAWATSIIGWAFGSTASSAKKDDTISQMSKPAG